MNRASFFFNDTATTEIYTLSLHDALPIYLLSDKGVTWGFFQGGFRNCKAAHTGSDGKPKGDYIPHHQPFQYYLGFAVASGMRSEEHTSELQSPDHLVCRLLLEKKKKYSGPTTRPSRCEIQPESPHPPQPQCQPACPNLAHPTVRTSNALTSHPVSTPCARYITL